MKQFLALFIVLASILFITCSKNTADEAPNPKPPVQPVDYKLSEDVIVIEDNLEGFILEVKDGRVLTLSSSISKSRLPTVGDILLKPEVTTKFPYGFLGEVTDVKEANGVITINTEEVPLDEAFKELELYDTFDITDDITTLLDPEGNEIEFTKVNGTRAGSDDIYLEIPIISTKFQQFKISGKLKLALNFGIDIKIKDWELQYLNAFISPRIELSGDIKSSVPVGWKGDVELFSIPHAVIQAGPLTIIPKVVIYLHINATGEIAVNATLKAGLGATYGLKKENNVWGGYMDSNNSNDNPFELSSAFTINGQLKAGLKISELFSFYGRNVGVGLSIIPTVGIETNFKVDAQNYLDGKLYSEAKNTKVKIGSFISGDAFVMAKLFKKTLAKYSVATPEVEFPIYQKYILPHFQDFVHTDNGGDDTKATFQYGIPNDLFFSCKIGVALIDDKNLIVDKKYHAVTHQDGVDFKYKLEFNNLNPSKYYTVKPILNFFNSIEIISDSSIAIGDNDRDILVKLYNDTGGDNWFRKDNWLSDKPIGEWHGVVTNAEGRIADLYLGGNHLVGSIDLSGCSALKTMHCYNNQLTTIDVSGCSALESLGSSDNQLTTLDVSGCIALKELACSSNKLTILDISGYGTLELLSCSDNQLTTLDVSGCIALKELACSSNKLTILDISGYGTLELLSCSDNQLTTLDVSGCSALKNLSCSNNQLTSLNASGCGNLMSLPLGYPNKIENLDVSDCKALKNLEWLGNQLSSLNAKGCSALESLIFRNNQLITLDVSGCIALKTLYCFNNQLTNLDVSGCRALESLNCGNNPLVSLNASGCAALHSLSCSYNQLASLNVSGCKALQGLECSGGRLINLYADGCSALESLGSSDNQLTTLDVSGCIALKTLHCSNNQLTTLDVSDCSALKTLHCSNNQLTTIDVSGCSALESLGCSNNQLTTLDVSECGALRGLSCDNNKILSEIPSWFSQISQFFYNYEIKHYDVRYSYYKDQMLRTKYIDKGVGWWYPGEPERGYHRYPNEYW